LRYITFILLLLTLFACNKDEEKESTAPVAKKEKVIKEFGFVLNNFKVVNLPHNNLACQADI
jgi:hypothetical protein